MFNIPDLDDLLSYKTQKVVVIRDRFLGGLYLLGVLGVVCYFVIDQMILKQAYMKREIAVSAIETTLEGPAAPNQLQPSTALSYCQGGPGGSETLAPLPCVTGPAPWVQAPSEGGAEMFIATRLKDVTNGAEVLHYVQDPEHYTIGISVTIYAEHLSRSTDDPKYRRGTQELQVQLLDREGNVVSGALKRIDRYDVIELATLAQAAGLSDINSVRFKGTVILLSLHCPMQRDGSVRECNYEARHLKDTQAEKAIVTGVEADAAEKKVQGRRGIKILVSASGEMGRFEWSSFMVAWVTCVGMMGMVIVGVDVIMAKCMPLREEYKLLKFQQSVDFSDYRHGDAKAVDRISRLKAHRESPPTSQSSDLHGVTAPPPQGVGAADIDLRMPGGGTMLPPMPVSTAPRRSPSGHFSLSHDPE